MDAAKNLLIEFEQRLWKVTGKVFPKSTPKNNKISYIVQYQIPDESGSISIMATSTNEMNIVFYKAVSSGPNTEIYVTPYISSITKIEETLNWLYDIIADSAYNGYNHTIEEYTEFFKKKYIF